MLPPQTNAEQILANDARKRRRMEAAQTTAELDALAHELRAEGLTWEAIAERIGYANGAIARRAALRHNPSAANTPSEG